MRPFSETILYAFLAYFSFSDSAQITELPLDGVFSTVTGAFRIQDGGTQYYGFAARSYGYSNEVMTVYYILTIAPLASRI